MAELHQVPNLPAAATLEGSWSTPMMSVTVLSVDRGAKTARVEADNGEISIVNLSRLTF